MRKCEQIARSTGNLNVPCIREHIKQGIAANLANWQLLASIHSEAAFIRKVQELRRAQALLEQTKREKEFKRVYWTRELVMHSRTGKVYCPADVGYSNHVGILHTPGTDAQAEIGECLWANAQEIVKRDQKIHLNCGFGLDSLLTPV